MNIGIPVTKNKRETDHWRERLKSTIPSKGVAVSDATTTVTGTADLTYDATERDMLNALKADVESIKTTLNDLLASLRDANLISK